MSSPAICVNNLDYYYPGKHALIGVNFTVDPQSITALVGPNGAGKTTLMRVLAGLDTPFQGSVQVGGIDVIENPRLAHTKLGYLSDSFGLYNELSVKQVLEYIAKCHNLDTPQATKATKWVTSTLSLTDILDQLCGTLSRGWRQRVGIAMSIIHRPQILLLDEPASGLDPESRADLSRILKTLREDGMTIMVSSHILAELEEYCSAMLVMREGRIREHVTLAAHQQKSAIKLIIRLSTALATLQDLPEITKGLGPNLSDSGKILELTTTDDQTEHSKILSCLLSAGISVCEFVVERKKLQSLYLDIAHDDLKAKNNDHAVSLPKS